MQVREGPTLRGRALRRRLIVIGDLDAWSRHRYFKDLAQHELIHGWTPER
ncbi:hypothetical protein [Streptomyces reniochalinae]|nr:hypothetical protein [Streptomyces reniochalinae]